jgi:hypothetical protein
MAMVKIPSIAVGVVRTRGTKRFHVSAGWRGRGRDGALMPSSTAVAWGELGCNPIRERLGFYAWVLVGDSYA